MTMFQMVPEPVHRVKQPRAPRISEEEWKLQRPNIEKLYLTENRKLKEVIDVMQQRSGFRATRRQYEYHFALWKIGKYAPRTGPTEVEHVAPQDIMVQAHGIGAEIPVVTTAAEDLPPLAQQSGTDSEWLSNLLPPLLWDSTFNFVEQELAAFQGKDAMPSEVSSASSDVTPLARFIDCRFTEVDDQNHTHQNQNEVHNTLAVNHASEHHWQTPGSLSRLWEVEMPVNQRTVDQQYRVQKLLWCLWLCGNSTCFTNLARRVQYRIVRVGDDIVRFESSLERWIESSSGCPEGMMQRQGSTRSSTNLEIEDGGVFQHNTALQNNEKGINRWQVHAALGHHMAVLKATRNPGEARNVYERLTLDLESVPGRWSFFSSFLILVRIVQKCLTKEISNLRGLDSDVREYIRHAFESDRPSPHTTTEISDEQKAIGALAFLCQQRWTQNSGYSVEQVTLIEMHTGFSIAKAFQWIMRLLLFHSTYKDPEKSDTIVSHHDFSLTPQGLCSKALNGLSALKLFDQAKPDRAGSEDWQTIRLSEIWLHWLYYDNAWFLPSIMPVDLTKSPTNLWQASNR